MDLTLLLSEFQYKAIRSSGSGGQHVNKVASKVELTFDVVNSAALTDEEKELLYTNLATKLTQEKVLILTCQQSRSQHKNKEIVTQKLLEILTKGLKIPKKRKATKPTKTAVKKRLDDKKKASEKKQNRKKLDF